LDHAGVSLEALEYVARRVGSAPIQFVGTYGTTEVDRHPPLTRLIDGFRGSRRFAHIELNPFGSGEHRALVTALVTGLSLDDDLARRLHDLIEGHACRSQMARESCA
jgi:hypothetical protein